MLITWRLSDDCLNNKKRLENLAGLLFTEVSSQFSFPEADEKDVIVDGLFGTGLNKPLDGGYAGLVKRINASPAKVVSIDIPSGLMSEDNTYNNPSAIVRADLTLTIQLPKLAFFFGENQKYLGEVKPMDIGLSAEGLAAIDCSITVIEPGEVKKILKPCNPFAHKGSMGHALLVSGQYGMGGATILAAKACLRSGVGKLTVHTPDMNNNILQWDGTERIAHVLHHFLGAAEDEYTCEAMKIFLLGAIKRVFQPGCKFETMLCLVGGQGAGKSSFFRLLAVKDEWFSDDLRRLDDDNVYRKLQGHWIIEMSEMIATANAKSIEEIKSFLSKQKETYKIPYETHPADRLRQCVFAGTTNRQDFLPRDRTGNRRFIPIPVDAELAEVHILDDETESRTYIDQLWAEAMTIYNSGNYKLAFSPAMQETLQAHQQDFMQEDAQAGMIYAFLEDYTGDRVCSKQLYAEALGNTNIPAEWETRAICEIMNTGISRGDIQGWQAHKTAKRYPKYGVQKGWERVTSPETGAEDFSEITDAEAKQMGFPF